MNPAFIAREVLNVLVTAAGHLDEDRVFFTMQMARRLPKPASRAVGSALRYVNGPAASAASAWLLGEEVRAADIVIEHAMTSPSRLLGEIALNLGMVDTAARIAGSVPGGARLRSRVDWTTGDLDAAVEALPQGHRRTRLDAERRTLEPGWWPEVGSHVVARRTVADADDRPMRSLHVLTNSLPHTRSGYAYRSHAVLTTLQEAGHIAVAATRPSYPVTVGRLSSGPVETIDGVSYLRHVPMVPAPTPTGRLAEQATWIAEEADRREIDVLHTTTHYVNGLAVGAAARALGVPWVYEVRGVLEETWAAAGATAAEREARRGSQRFGLMRAKEIEVAASADAVVTLGETMRDHLIASGIRADSITLIPNSVSEAVVAADVFAEPAEVRARLGLPVSGVWVGTAASIVGYEGLGDLVDAVTIARSLGSDLRLLVVGDGIALPELKERARPLGDAAVFTGRLPQSAAIDHQLGLDIMVVPRTDEPVCRLVTPIKPIEAMGLARPVVVSDLPALRELVPETAGLAARPSDPIHLADVLTELAHAKDTRVRMGQCGRDHVMSSRRWKDIGLRYSEVYSRLRGAEAT